VKDGVKSDVPKPEFACHDLELRLAVIPNQGSRIIGANRQIEHAIDRTSYVLNIHNDRPRWSRCRFSGNGWNKGKRERAKDESSNTPQNWAKHRSPGSTIVIGTIHDVGGGTDAGGQKGSDKLHV
jgi:hypothetical protein